MMGTLSKIALLAASFLVASCSKPEPASTQKPLHIKGQVFVIQKDLVNVKLGGVDVRYLPREVFETRCRWIEKNAPKATLLASYEKDLLHIDSVIAKAIAEEHAGKIREFLYSAMERQTDAWRRFKENPALESYRRLLLAAEENRDPLEAAGFAGSEEQWAISAVFSEWLERQAVVSTQTDADGYYSLSLPAPGNGFVFAQSSRQISGDDVEKCYWIQEVSPSTPGPVHLSTTSAISPSILNDFIHRAPAPAPMSMKTVVEEFGLRDLTWFTEAENLLRQIAKNEDSVARLKSRIEEVEDEIEKTKYMDMGSP